MACTCTTCCFPPEPPLLKPGPGTGPPASLSLPPQHLLFHPGLYVFPTYNCEDFNPPLVGAAGLGSGCRVLAADCKAACFFHEFFPVGQDQAASQALWRQRLSCAQERQRASANHWLDVGTRQMDAMCLVQESLPATKGPAHSGLDICSYVSEILPMCLVVFNFVLSANEEAWTAHSCFGTRRGGRREVVPKALNPFLNTATIAAIA